MRRSAPRSCATSSPAAATAGTPPTEYPGGRPERCPSGLRSATGNRVGGVNPPRGFESHPLRCAALRKPPCLVRGCRRGLRHGPAARLRDDRGTADHQRLLLCHQRDSGSGRPPPTCSARCSRSAVVSAAYLLAEGAEKRARTRALARSTTSSWACSSSRCSSSSAGATTPSRRNGWGNCSRRRRSSPSSSASCCSGFFPSDLVTSFSVGTHLADDGDPWWTSASPSSAYRCCSSPCRRSPSPRSATALRPFLPKVRDWMSTNSWIVSEVVLVFFVAIILSG